MTGTRESRLAGGTRGPDLHAPLRFRVLGPLEVLGHGGPVALGGPKQRAVLALLILRAGEVVPADALADALWGDEPPDSSANVIQTYVSLLRRELGGQRIVTQGGGYVLRLAPEELDVVLFEGLVREARRSLPVEPELALGSLDDALQLWRGPALADVADQPRIAVEASRLDEARLDARELRVEAMLAAGQDARALGEIDSLVAADPLRERLWGLRMRTLYRQGRQAEALEAYRQLRRILRDELGIDPSPELTRLQQQVLEQDPMLESRGRPLRGYRLLERLHEAPDEVVFRAIQPSIGRDVTVRVVSGQVVASAASVRDVERRLAAVASLEHPHIAPIFDHWREDGRAYVVSRYLRGGTLRATDERADPMAPERAAAIIAEIGFALAHAHQQGIAHGRLSSERIAFDTEGRAYLVDFAIASTTEDDVRTDVLGFLTLARRLMAADPDLQTTLRRLGDDGHEVGASEVVAAVRTRIDPSGLAHGPSHGEIRDPYKGLRAFGESDARDFHGRGALTRRLIDRLREAGPGSRFLAIVGPSGAGKSSLLRAGLVPAIRDGALHPAELTYVTDLYPGEHPLEELEAALGRLAEDTGRRGHRRLGGDDRALLEAASRILPDGAQLVIVIDQLEELFTLTSREAERDRFLELIRVACVDPGSPIRVIVTLRADFYDRPLREHRFGELLARRTEAVAALGPDELEAAIQRPADGVGARLEPGLVVALVAEAAQQPGALPHLQFTLTTLFEQRVGATLTLEAYRSLGGLGGALSARADQQVASLSAAGREVTRQVFLRLVTLREGREDTRRRVPRVELGSLVTDPGAVEEVIDAFGRQRLLTFDRDPVSREPTVEIAHEALLTAWARLRTWIDEAREDLREEASLAHAAAEWRASDRDSSFLLRGLRLDQAEGWASGTSLVIGREARAFLKASLDERDADRRTEAARREREAALERRSRSRLRILVAVLAGATLVAGTMAVVALREADRAERQGRVAQARELAGAALASLASDPELAVLLASSAVETTRLADATVVPEAATALHRAVVASRARSTIPASGGGVAWAPDGTLAVTAPDPGVVEFRLGTSMTMARSALIGERAITDLASSPDGRWLASTGEDGSLRLLDLRMDGAGRVIHRGVGAVGHPSFSGDSTRVAATWGHEGLARVFDVATARMLMEVALVEPSATALSPDGSVLIVSAMEGGEQAGVAFDVDTGRRRPAGLVLPGEYDGVAGIAWSPDGELIATVGMLGADLWDAASLSYTGHVPDTPGANRVAWSPDGARLALGDDEDARVTVVEVGGAAHSTPLALTALETSQGIADLAFSPDREHLVAVADDGGAAKVWSLGPDAGAEVLALATVERAGDVAFTPDGRAIVAAGEDGRLRSWDLATARGSRPIGFRVAEHSFELSPDGSTLAMPLFQNGVAAWELGSGRRRFLRSDVGWVDEVAWSPDGQHLVASVHEPEARTLVLDRDGEVVTSFAEPGVPPASARFDPSGRLVATIAFDDAGHGVTLWDWRSAAVERRLPPMEATMLTFSPDGARLAAGFGLASVVDAASGDPTVVLDGSPLTVNDVRYSPDGSLLAAASGDGHVRLFDTQSGAMRLILDAGDGRPVARLAFDQDGSMLATQSPGMIRVWALDVEDLLTLARTKVTRPLTTDECRRFLHLDACPTPEG